jgi:hypothetical protein
MFICSTVLKGRTYYRVRWTYRSREDKKVRHRTIALGTSPSIEGALREREEKYFAARKGRPRPPFTKDDYDAFLPLYELDWLLSWEVKNSGYVRSRRVSAEIKRAKDWERARRKAQEARQRAKFLENLFAEELAKEHLDILGVQPGASPEDIKAAYRRKAREHHPDHGGDEETMKQLNAAKAMLLDEANQA